MRRGGGIIALGLIVVFVSGCGISKDRYMKLENEKDELQLTVSKLSRGIDQLEREKDELLYTNQSLQNEIRRLRQERDALEGNVEAGAQGKLGPEEVFPEESTLK